MPLKNLLTFALTQKGKTLSMEINNYFKNINKIMNLAGYEKEFMQNEVFTHFRPLNSPIVQAAVLFQLVRGGLFALILYPFRDKFINSKYRRIYLYGNYFEITYDRYA